MILETEISDVATAIDMNGKGGNECRRKNDMLKRNGDGELFTAVSSATMDDSVPGDGVKMKFYDKIEINAIN